LRSALSGWAKNNASKDTLENAAYRNNPSFEEYLSLGWNYSDFQMSKPQSYVDEWMGGWVAYASGNGCKLG
jgi:hypothetical protein